MCLDWILIVVVSVIAGLKEKWTEATMRNDVKAIVLTGQFSQFYSLISSS